ncbi:(deoxy)nucleoside triphosphate pyrophosphohydrolase [Eremococcus coleocola]|uniref:(deoxy)nucleoside triphosphate pyrophosphohydrolase n=1 Tax=Eremococcus coleocola TaxID=88132 RepID=UPI00200A8D47|nr:NUDIX domain-containing protein [Eremococcus coleocola]
MPELWEFPGGKIEASENPPQTLVRERKEELDLEFEVLDYINTADYGYNFGHLTLSTYTVKIIKGQSILKEHMASKWLAPDQVMDLNWAPVDVAAGGKIVSVYPNNISKDITSVPATMVMLNEETREVNSIMDGTFFTRLERVLYPERLPTY